MSKILVVLLLALNLGLFLLIQQQTKDQSTQALVPGGDLVLASEQTHQADTEATANGVFFRQEALDSLFDDKTYCYSYGPLESQLAAIGAMASLKEVARSPQIRRVPAGTQHWLLLRQTVNRDETQLSSIDHSYARILFGELKGRLLYQISTNAQQADSIRQQQRAKGITLDQETLELPTPMFWVDFTSDQAHLNPRLLGLLSEQRLLIQAGHCPDSATPPEPPSSRAKSPTLR